MFILLNLAIGEIGPGNPTGFASGKFDIDYVR
jgi:hypothetical protein